MSKQLKGVEIFAVGKHNGMPFAEKDLEAMVTSFAALEKASRVPLKLGHNDEQPFTDGQPALGWVQRLWHDGKKVFADFVDLPTVVYDAIKKGLYKQVSVELLQNYSQNGSRYPWVLNAVALLGSDIPAVKGLKDLNALMMASEVTGVQFTKAAAFTSDATTFGETSTMTPEEEAKLRNDLAEANRKATESAESLRKFTEEVKKDKVAAHRKAVTDILEAAVSEGRIYPRTRDRIVNARLFKDDNEVLTAYTIESVKEEIKSEQRNDFKEKPAGKTGATSMSGEGNQPDLTGKSNSEVVLFMAEQECVRLGHKITDYDAMLSATQRVLASNKELAKAHHNDPTGAYQGQATA